MSEQQKMQKDEEDSRSGGCNTARDPTLSEDTRTACSPSDQELADLDRVKEGVPEFDLATPEMVTRVSDPASEAALGHTNKKKSRRTSTGSQ